MIVLLITKGYKIIIIIIFVIIIIIINGGIFFQVEKEKNRPMIIESSYAVCFIMCIICLMIV